MLSKRNLFIVFLVIAAVIIAFSLKFSPDEPKQPPSEPKTNQNKPNEAPKIVSTKPDPLNESIVSATEVIEITFNRPLENVGEFKVKIEPGKKIKVELSGDRKTAKIIPLEPYDLGAGYTLFIGSETKFDGVGRWGEEKVFHFRTIRYTGV